MVGGYVPVRGGAIDWIAVTTARMNGWKTRTFLEKTCLHHRPMGTGSGSVLKARFRHGIKDYYVGSHPLWQLLRGAFQMREKPYFIGGMLLIAGYCWAWANRLKAPLPSELRAFHRSEQLTRLREYVREVQLSKYTSARP